MPPGAGGAKQGCRCPLETLGRALRRLCSGPGSPYGKDCLFGFGAGLPLRNRRTAKDTWFGAGLPERFSWAGPFITGVYWVLYPGVSARTGVTETCMRLAGPKGRGGSTEGVYVCIRIQTRRVRKDGVEVRAGPLPNEVPESLRKGPGSPTKRAGPYFF